MKIKLSHYTPRKVEGTIIITKVSTLILKELTRIYLNLDAIHVMKEDTMLEIVLGTKWLSQEEGKQEKTSC